VSYHETIQLHLRAAECYLYMGLSHAANVLLQNIFNNARTPLDKAPAWVLQSRIFAQGGDSNQALDSLKQCLTALNIEIDENPTYEKCDREFEQLSVRIRTMDRDSLLDPTATTDPSLASLGAVLTETISAGWWSDCAYFYHLSLLMMNIHLDRGAVGQHPTHRGSRHEHVPEARDRPPLYPILTRN